MMEADALAEIIGDVRQRTDATAHARRLYDNPRRALIEGELEAARPEHQAVRVGGLRRGERQAREHRERVVAGEGDTVAGHRQRHRERSDGGGSEGGTRARIANGGSGGGEAGGEAHGGRLEGAEDAGLRHGRRGCRGDQGRHAEDAAVETRELLRLQAGHGRVRGSGGSSGSALGNPVAAVEHFGGKINAFDVDKVAVPLKELLAEERAALLDGVEYLQACLEDEADRGKRVEAPAPEVEELTAYGDKLREVWEGEKERAEHIVKVERMFDQPSVKGRVGKLRSMAATLSEVANGDRVDLDDDTSARVDRLVIGDRRRSPL